MNKKIILCAMIVMIALLLSSCTTIGTKGSAGNSQNYRTGTKGIVFNFINNNPPSRIYNGDALTLTVEYVNKGAYDVIGGYFYLTGYDENIIFLDRSATNFAAKGKSIYNPDGVLVETASFMDSRIVLPENFNAEELKQNFLLTACYDYETLATPLVCIDPDPYTTNPVEKTCTVKDVSLSGGQGAPVAVTLVQEESSRNKVQFKIHVSNVGGGDVIDPTVSVANCHTQLRTTDMDKVSIHAEFSGRPLLCEPQIIRLSGGSGFAYCSAPTEDFRQMTAYNTILNIYIDYGYRDSISKSVQIINR